MQEQPQSIAAVANDPSADPNFAELDRALQNVRYSLDAANPAHHQPKVPTRVASNPALNPALKRHHSLPYGEREPATQTVSTANRAARRSLRHAPSRYETPCEEDELLDEALASAHRAARRLDDASSNATHASRPPLGQVSSEPAYPAPYLTPSHSKDQMGVNFGAHDYTPSKPMDIPPMSVPQKQVVNPQWPTPPYDENDWASAAAASIFATQAAYR